MIRTLYCMVFFSSLLLVSFSLAHAQGKTDSNRPCNDTQYAANLAAIEKRLLQTNTASVELLDTKARNWYSKFQEGGLLFDGWQEISEDVVAQVPDGKKVKTKVTMLALGVKIGCEWSKENDIRKISTSMLQDWGKILRKTVEDSPDNLSVVINSIESEVDELLFEADPQINPAQSLVYSSVN